MFIFVCVGHHVNFYSCKVFKKKNKMTRKSLSTTEVKIQHLSLKKKIQVVVKGSEQESSR